MSKQTNSLRALIGRRVRVRGYGHKVTGNLIGPLDTWRSARPDLAAANPRHPKLWAVVGANGGRLAETYFSPSDVRVTVELAA